MSTRDMFNLVMIANIDSVSLATCTGVCIHRSTLHSIERGSIEVNHDLCLLCVCQLSGSLHCIHTC